MTSVSKAIANGRRTAMLRRGVSAGAMLAGLLAAPVLAQTAQMLRSTAGLTAPVVTPAATLPVQAITPNAAGLNSASARAIANQARLAGAVSLAQQANAAARAAAPAGVIPNGLVAGGLVPVANPVIAGLDPTGLNTWQGAALPSAAVAGSTTTVTVRQTDARALLSWSSFNIGRDTILHFDQQPDWVVVNRIVDNINPATGRLIDPVNLRPSTILGQITGAGTVLVLNQNGVLFGPSAQVNLRSLLVTSIEIGAQSRQGIVTGLPGSQPIATSISDRNNSFLQNGLLGGTTLLSAIGQTSRGFSSQSVGDNPDVEGGVVVQTGTAITAGDGGFVIIGAPQITNSGQLSATNGQVSLVSGRQITAVASTGAPDITPPVAGAANASVRGLILGSTATNPTFRDSITNTATGLISAPRGLISIGATASGQIVQNGVLTSTTSVSRNGKVALTAGIVTVGAGSVIAITPDTNGETIPQAADSVANFKRSVVDIGNANTAATVTPAIITIGANALIYAPSASVNIGGTPSATSVDNSDNLLGQGAGSLFIDSGATIDVSGIKDLVLPAARNSVRLSPVQRNELRDTPNYREVTTDGSFTLNPSTLFIDARLSGVRADGVAWVGSPLIEAGSAVAQIGVTAAELMTPGGTLTLSAGNIIQGTVPVAGVQPLGTITVRPNVTLDISGGWVRFADGVVQTSRLRTADGRLVEIGRADPNDNFVAVVDPISASQERFGVTDTFGNPLATDPDFQTGYLEGRDAGALILKAATDSFAGTVFGQAFAGTQQIARASEGSVAGTIGGDTRTLQATPLQLPTGGLFKVQAYAGGLSALGGGADIVVYNGNAAAPARLNSSIQLADTLLSNSGLAAVALQTSGGVSLLGGTTISLAPNGGLVIDAGRSIRLDGTVRAPSGTINARTYELTIGSVFDVTDDLPLLAVEGAPVPSLFDITVTGTLSARGRFQNDALVGDGAFLGTAYADGGSISLTVAPRVLLPIAESATAFATFAADYSGSLFVQPGALLDVSAGAAVRANGTPVLTARGGSVALVNQTTYFNLQNEPAGLGNNPQGGFVGTNLPGFRVAPDGTRVTGASPLTANARVVLAPGTIRAGGFAGGGQFTLVTPDLNFGARPGATGTAIPFDFISTTGFANFNFTTYTTQFLGGTTNNGVFANGVAGTTALLATEQVRVAAGEMLNLTQALLPSLLNSGQLEAVRGLASGGNVGTLLGTGIPADAFDQRGVALTFGGLTEVDVDPGGRIIGADGASLTSSTLLNAGTIRLPGGTLRQVESLPSFYLVGARTAVGVQDLGEVFGGDRDADGLFDPDAPNAAGVRIDNNPANALLSNADLVTRRLQFRAVYLLGEVGSGEGARLTPGSVTDLSGASIRNPRASTIGVEGRQRVEGRLVGGGTLESGAAFAGQGVALFANPQFGAARYGAGSERVTVARAGLTLNALPRATIDLSGIADNYDQEVSLGVFAPTPVWSNGGRLTAGAGGSISGALVRADGGATQAEGGILTWRTPTLQQADTPDRTLNILSANQIMTAGFDTFVAQQQLTGFGPVSLNLGRGFYLTNQPFDGLVLSNYGASAATSGALSITAPYIQLSSLEQRITPAGRVPAGTGAITLNAGAIDIIGSVLFDPTVAAVRLLASGDVRVTGVQPKINVLDPSGRAEPVSLSGQLVASGDLTIRAAQLYPTTGTGNLQQQIDAARRGQAIEVPSYLIAATGPEARIRIERSGTATPASPYSAGGNLTIQAATVEQAGVIRVPVGRLTLGGNTTIELRDPSNFTQTQIVAPTGTLILAANSITAVSAGGLSIPYGTTTDLTEYFFSPTSNERLTAPPAADLRLGGGVVTVQAGATVDLSGGGDLYAYEFASGVGGSRDVLSRFNSDAFSSRNGFQYPDGRQVYAIVPSLAGAQVALSDPIYSADYANLYGPSDAGRRVYLEGGNGIAAGWYTLLPARYALLPGGLRVVENVGQNPGALASTTTLRDGSMIVNGRYGVAGTGFEDSTRRSFTVQSQDSFRRFSRIALTSATTTFANLATRDDLVVPRLPRDAARLVLAPLAELNVNTRFLTEPASGGRGGQVDITGNAFEIVTTGAPGSLADTVTLRTADFANLNAASLLIGGIRTDFADGTTALAIGTRSIAIANSSSDPLSAPEIVLAVDGVNSAITLADGSAVVATGTLADTRTGNYVIATGATQTAVGGIVRVANGPERLVLRPGDVALANSLSNTSIVVGSATGTRGVTLTGTSVLLDSSRDLVIYDNPATAASEARITATNLALGGDDVFFTDVPSGFRGLTITPAMEALFGAAQRLTISSKSIVGFRGGVHSFNDLVLDVRGIRPFRPGEPLPSPAYTAPFPPGFDPAATPQTPLDPAVPIAVTIRARDFSLSNSDTDRGPCTTGDVSACGTAGNSLAIEAATVHFGSGAMRVYGFDSSVAVTAPGGVFAEGSGRFDVGGAALSFATPFIGDRALSADPRGTKVQPDLTIATRGALAISNPGNLVAPVVAQAPGAVLYLGDADTPLAALTIDGTQLRASAGTLEARALGDIIVSGDAVMATPSYAKTFGDSADKVTVSAPGGRLTLISLTGDVALGSATRLAIGGTAGEAGTLELSAATGVVLLDGIIDAAAPGNGASLHLDTGGAFDFSGFLTTRGAPYTGDIRVRSGVGNLALAAGQTLRVTGLRLTADGGLVDIAGTVDTSGINGGNIGLFGAGGVTLRATAILDARASGYGATDTRVASGGNVDLGTADGGVLAVVSGAVIDVSARRPGARLVAGIGKDLNLNDTVNYRYAESDTGGLVRLRAPIIELAGSDSVAIDFAGAVTGAREVSVEAVKRFDLGVLGAGANCAAAAVCINADGQAVLDLNATKGSNILADDFAGSVPNFVRSFDIGAADARLGGLTALPGYRARPGIELDYAGDIVLASNWNLGAGVVDTAAALADGLFTVNLALGANSLAVVPGAESLIYSGYTDFRYRVKNPDPTLTNAGGAAPVLTLRAAGNLDLRGSISDGFFAFSDQTDPNFISYQLGGGDRLFRPVTNINCGTDRDCFVIGDFALAPVAPAATTAININLGIFIRGRLLEAAAPYSAAANAPGARGLQANGAGDPLGSASLAPRLTSGAAADSTSYRLVAGANLASSDPLTVAPGAEASVSLSGETTYRIRATGGQPAFNGALQFTLNTPSAAGGGGAFDAEDIYAIYNASNQLDNPNQLTRLAFGGAPAAARTFIRQRAAAFFADYPGQSQMFGPGGGTIITAGIELLARFLASIDADFSAGVANGTLGYPPLTATPPAGVNTTVSVRSLIRTGSGNIEIAAARDVDLRNTVTPVFRNIANRPANAGSTSAAQVGGTAVYTAGVRADFGPRQATVAGTGTVLTFDPSAEADTSTLTSTFAPEANGVRQFFGVLQTDLVYAEGGGGVAVRAGRDVLGRRDIFSEAFRSGPALGRTSGTQLWRVGSVGVDRAPSIVVAPTNIRIDPQLFSTGIGALGGGDIDVVAGRDVRDLAVVADTSVSTGAVTDASPAAPNRVLATYGHGDVAVAAGRDLLGGLIDVASGSGRVDVGGRVTSAGLLRADTRRDINTVIPGALTQNLTRVRVADADVALDARQSIELGAIAALGVRGSTPINGAGFYSAAARVDARSSGNFRLANSGADSENQNPLVGGGFLLPGSLLVTSLFGDIDVGGNIILYPSPIGQLQLLAGGDLLQATISMDDGDPSLAPGALSAFVIGPPIGDSQIPAPVLGTRAYGFPVILPNTSDFDRRLLHNRSLTHLGDAEPVRIAVDGSIDKLTLSTPKATRLSAGVDLIDTVFIGQNLTATDVTRITAGRDIIGTSRVLPVSVPLAGGGSTTARLPTLQGNTFALGGPGTLFVEAGRDLGPFFNSATVAGNISYAGGILTVGNDYNPWLGTQGAKIYAEFGVGKGANYDALRDTYVDPANVANLDGDLFVQVTDVNGNQIPDRTRPIYAPILVDYMVANFPGLLQAAFSTTAVTPAQAYAVFLTLPALTQRQFLLDQVYFNELSIPARPTGPSFNQFIRSYRAVELLFPAARGYTANDLSGTSNGGVRIKTGNLDLRLATIESQRGGDITILGPGGRAVAGSVVSTSAQAARRGEEVNTLNLFSGLRRGPQDDGSQAARIISIPLGFEGVLTLRGGAIRGFTDGDFLLNQSRLFTQAGGNVTLFSSNGDLNAGQGPRTSANFPPVVLRFTPNAFSEVDTAGAVAGAGIAAFQPRPDIPAPDVILVAPAGTVDAGDAGVRAAGNVFIAAAQVANSAGISAGGTITGSGAAAAVDTTAAANANAAGTAGAAAAAAVNPQGVNSGDRTRITVDVLGFGGDPNDDPCRTSASSRPSNCPAPTTP